MVSTTAQYALTALAALAEEPEKSLLGRVMAQKTGIPANYLSKVLLALGNAGLVEASRGTGGGYRLARDPNDIRLIEVMELFDAPRVKPTCLLGLPDCSDENACSAHSVWRGIRARFINFLESTTVADISNSKVRSPFQVSAPPGTVSTEP